MNFAKFLRTPFTEHHRTTAPDYCDTGVPMAMVHYIFVKFQHYSLLIYNSFIMYSRLSILQTPNRTKTLILRTEVHLPLFHSNESLINPFCITNVPYSELSLLRTIFSLLLTKDTSI